MFCSKPNNFSYFIYLLLKKAYFSGDRNFYLFDFFFLLLWSVSELKLVFCLSAFYLHNEGEALVWKCSSYSVCPRDSHYICIKVGSVWDCRFGPAGESSRSVGREILIPGTRMKSWQRLLESRSWHRQIQECDGPSKTMRRLDLRQRVRKQSGETPDIPFWPLHAQVCVLGTLQYILPTHTHT